MTEQAQQTAWRPATFEAGPMLTSEGDGLEPLRKVRQRYYNRANKIARRRTDPETSLLPEKYHAIVAWYRQQGDRVNLLIPEDKEFIDVIETESALGETMQTIAVIDAQDNVTFEADGGGVGCTPSGSTPSVDQEGQPVAEVQEGTSPAEQDGEGTPQPSVGYSVDYLTGPTEAGTGTITVEEPGAGVSGTSENQTDLGTTETQ